MSKAGTNSNSKLKFNFNSFSFLQKNIVSCTLYHVGTRQEALPPTTPALLPAARSAHRVNAELGKVLNLLFISFGSEQNFPETMVLLNPFSAGIL